MYKRGDVVKFHDMTDLRFPTKGRLYTIHSVCEHFQTVHLKELPGKSYSMNRLTKITLVEDV